MLAARGGRSEKEKDRKDRNHYKSTGLCSQRRGWGWSGGGGPSREERGGGKWHEPRETRPRSGHPTRPNPPPDPTPPTHERDTAPLPTQITRRDTVSPPMGRHTRPGTPMGETALPPREVSQGDASLRDFHMVNTSPPNTRTAPTQGRNGSRGPPSGESGILEPLGEKTIQRDAQPYSKCCRTDTLIGEMGEGQRHLFRGASETAFPWKESRPKTDLS